ncbi:MAG TPA: hypothetical protein VFY91_09450 [Microbacterium sp.]|nr:hypothetical protein [Microbacterium sp.]
MPELSRRARGVPVWAVLRCRGSDGVAALIEGLADAARDLAHGLGAMPRLEVLNDVVFTQVCVALPTDGETRALADALRSDGVAFASTSRWRDREVLRFSVSNAGTDAEAVRVTLAAVEAALPAASVPAP